MFGCCTCERANRAEAAAKVAPAPSGAAAGGRQGQTGKRRSVKAAAFEEPPQTDSKDGPGPATVLPSAKDPVQVEPEDANLNTRPPSAYGQDGQSGQALQATQAREHEVTELTEAPKRTRRRSHFVPSDAAAAAAEAASPLTAASAEPGTGQLQTLVEDPTSGFQGTHKACLLGVTKTVHGSTPLVESEFKEKFVEHSGCDSEAAARSGLQKAGVTISCAKGRKAGTPNQDNFFVTECGSFLICCVADGHGSAGHWVSHWTCKFVLRMMLEQMEKAKSLPTARAMNEMFEKVHKEVVRTANAEKIEIALSGTTLSVAIVDREKRKILLAWAGDSRCVLGRLLKKGVISRLASGTAGKSECVGGSTDHKPNDPKEKRRVEENGGEVLLLPGDVPHRVFAKGKEIPGLAMSRSIGDLAGHMAGVIHQPGIEWLDFQKDDLLLCCSDGVWEFLSNVEALNIVSQVGKKKATEGVQKLSTESRKLWLAESDDCCDDITVIAVWLT